MKLKRYVKQFSAMLRRLLFQMSKDTLRVLVFVLVICVFSALVYTSASQHWFSATVRSRGAVRTLGVGVYWDSVCSNPVHYIEWGIIEPGSHTNVTVHIRNEGNVPMYISLNTTNWDPPHTSQYMTLSWDYSGQALQLNEVIETTLMLSVSSTLQNVTDFAFDITISQLG